MHRLLCCIKILLFAKQAFEMLQIRGLSKIAGFQGVMQTAVTRCLLVPCACLMFPPVFLAAWKAATFIPEAARKNPRVLLFLELGFIYASLQAALPGALAVFPETAEFASDDLEPEFRNLTDKSGTKITRFFASKGL